MNVESLKFEEIKTEYENLIRNKLNYIESEIEQCNNELEVIKRVEEKEAELEEIAEILERHNLNNEITKGFLNIIKNINNPSLAKAQIDKFNTYVINALSEIKESYTKNIEKYQQTKELIDEIEKPLDDPKSQKEMIIKLIGNDDFDDSEKLIIVKYNAYKSIIPVNQKKQEAQSEQEIDDEKEKTEEEIPTFKEPEKSEESEEKTDETEDNEFSNEEDSNSFKLPELEDIPGIIETKEEQKEEKKKDLFELSEKEDTPEKNEEQEEQKEEIPETPKEFNKKYGEDLKYAKHVLEKRESTHFDSFYDTLSEKSSEGLSDEEKELLEKCKVLANSLKSSYFNIDYEAEEIKKSLEEKEMEEVMEHYRSLKEDLDEYQPTFDDFKEKYLEFKSVFGSITDEGKEQKHKKNDDENEESSKSEDAEKVTGISRITGAIETLIHHKEKDDVDDDPLKAKYKEDLKIISQALEKYESLEEDEKSPTLLGIIESLKMYKDKGIPSNVTESEIEIIESSINWFKKRAESLGLAEKLFPEEEKKESEEEKGRRL